MLLIGLITGLSGPDYPQPAVIWTAALNEHSLTHSLQMCISENLLTLVLYIGDVQFGWINFFNHFFSVKIFYR